MTLCKLDKSIVRISGRLGGVYFKKDRFGQHCQAMPRTVRGPSISSKLPPQRAGAISRLGGIGIMSGMAAIWAMALLIFFGAAWVAFAATFYVVNKFGEKRKWSGYNWYMYYAMLAPETERPPFWEPPHAPGVLPDYYVNYKGMQMYRETPDEWGVASTAGYYWEGIEFNGQPTYHTTDFNLFIWFKDPKWVISPGVDFEPDGLTNYSVGNDLKGYYQNPDTHKFSSCWRGKRP